MTIDLLKTRVKQAETLCNDLEYDYEMKLQNLPFSKHECFAAFASTQLSRMFYDSLKLRLELLERSHQGDPYVRNP